ncbi:MAG: hypothetical protein NZZ41_02575 [Candidatus Dojkabacteria bacterium]|nr:hypothetical protein [Candidatus Dojkabacteria bacterium]
MKKLVKYEDIKEQIIEESKLQFLLNILKSQASSGLTPGQFTYLCLLYLENYAAIYEYLQVCHQKHKKFPFTKEEIDQLYLDNLIDHPWSSLYPDDAKITAKGAKLVEKLIGVSANSISYVKDKIELFGEELIKTYPDQFFGSNGQRFPTKGFSRTALPNGKYIEGKYALMQLYYETIQGSEEKHKEIISKIKKGLELNGPDNRGQKCPEIRTTLMKFVVNRMWETISLEDSDDMGSPLIKLV